MTLLAKRRADYRAPAFTISDIDLNVTLHPTATRVVSSLRVSRQGEHTESLVLDGEHLTLVSLSLIHI